MATAAREHRRYLCLSPAGNAVPFRRAPNPQSAVLEGQLEQGYLLNHLYYDKGVIQYDGLAANRRFRRDLSNDTLFFTHSSGKSITSCIVGHAICEGHISSVDEVIDWPMMRDTLYQTQRRRNLLNMKAGDRQVVDQGTNCIICSTLHNREMGLDTAAVLLRGTEPRGSGFYYNNFVTDVIEGYTAFKAGSDYPSLVRRVFRDKIKVADTVSIFQRPRTLTNGARSPYCGQPQARATYHYLITRMDFLRVAQAMMRDYQTNTCGKCRPKPCRAGSIGPMTAIPGCGSTPMRGNMAGSSTLVSTGCAGTTSWAPWG